MKLSKKRQFIVLTGMRGSVGMSVSKQALTDKAQIDLICQGSIGRIKNHMWDKIQAPV